MLDHLQIEQFLLSADESKYNALWQRQEDLKMRQTDHENDAFKSPKNAEN